MKNWRRFEILLPLRFNDGTQVPKGLLAQTVQQLEIWVTSHSIEVL